MTRLDLTALPWNNRRILCRAVADAMERWIAIRGQSFKGREREDVEKLCSCLRNVTSRAGRRLETAVVRDLHTLAGIFLGKSARFELALQAARIAINCWEGPHPTTGNVIPPIVAFQRVIDQTGLINIWDVFEPWRICDAFEVLSLDQIPAEARAAFDAIWLASEYKAAYQYASTWRTLHAVAA
jgi:hypothetical protein